MKNHSGNRKVNPGNRMKTTSRINVDRPRPIGTRFLENGER